MVASVRRGIAVREVARRAGVSHSIVLFWVDRAKGRRLDRVDFADRPAGCRVAANRVARRIERLVLELRRTLRTRSDLGEYGAAAIHRALVDRRTQLKRIPSPRTIGRILLRHGALDAGLRVRRPSPRRGWHLPDVAAQRVELDSIDIVEGLAIRGDRARRKPATEVQVLNLISLHGALPVLHGALPASWIRPQITAKFTMDALIEHWRRFGLPAYAQFDNDRIFTGAHARPNTIGRVIRLCLGLGVTPVFAVPREHGPQSMIESYNGRWQAKVWQRFTHRSINALSERSRRFVEASRVRNAVRIDAAPLRRAFPDDWKLDLRTELRGVLIFLRRTTPAGRANVLGRDYFVSRQWCSRMIRAEVDFDREQIRFYALRRRTPEHQPLLKTTRYSPPDWEFHE
jgi:putative transposase